MKKKIYIKFINIYFAQAKDQRRTMNELFDQILTLHEEKLEALFVNDAQHRQVLKQLIADIGALKTTTQELRCKVESLSNILALLAVAMAIYALF